MLITGTASLALPEGEGEPTPAISVASLSSPLIVRGEGSSDAESPNPPMQSTLVSSFGTHVLATHQPGTPSNSRRSPSQSSPTSQYRARRSDLQSFAEALRSRLKCNVYEDIYLTISFFLSLCACKRFKESISQSKREWKERWLSRNSAIADPGSEERRGDAGNAGIAAVSCMMEHLETRDKGTTSSNSVQNSSGSGLLPDTGTGQRPEAGSGSNGLSDSG